MSAASVPNLHRCLVEEFHRLAKPGRDYLTLDELLALRLPPSARLANFSHLGVLHELDSDGNGRVTLPDLAALAEQAHSYSRKHAPHEPLAHFECACMLRVYDAVARPGGTHHFVAWMCQMLKQVAPTQLSVVEEGDAPHVVEYFPREAIETLYTLFNIQEMHGMNQQALLDLLQRAGESSGLMRLDDEAFDELVPVDVVRELLEALCASLLKFLAPIHAEVTGSSG